MSQVVINNRVNRGPLERFKSNQSLFAKVGSANTEEGLLSHT